jgi:hypothetical protein
MTCGRHRMADSRRGRGRQDQPYRDWHCGHRHALREPALQAGEGLSARALKPKAFAGPAVHVRSEFMIESRRLVGDELNRTRLLRSQEERDASE